MFLEAQCNNISKNPNSDSPDISFLIESIPTKDSASLLKQCKCNKGVHWE